MKSLIPYVIESTGRGELVEQVTNLSYENESERSGTE
jgi:hypothetical protein